MSDPCTSKLVKTFIIYLNNVFIHTRDAHWLTDSGLKFQPKPHSISSNTLHQYPTTHTLHLSWFMSGQLTVKCAPIIIILIIIIIMITTLWRIILHYNTIPTLYHTHHMSNNTIFILLMTEFYYVSGLSRRLLNVSILLCSNSLSVFNSSHSCCNLRI